MTRHPKARITEGEIYGFPVPGGWPDRGPFRVLYDAFGGLFGRRKSSDRTAASQKRADDSPAPTSGRQAEHEREK